jgi:hypothetical protein
MVGREGAIGAGACAAGLLNATGFANVDGEAIVATGVLPTGALAAYRAGPKCRQPQKNEYRPAAHRSVQPQGGRRKLRETAVAGPDRRCRPSASTARYPPFRNRFTERKFRL